jgi:subtilase family serine protease
MIAMRMHGTFLAVVCFVALAGQVAAAQPLIPAAIDETDLVTLAGNTRPEATAANDRGPVADMLRLNHIQLQLRRPSDREAALERYVDGLTDPSSVNYHRWLSAEAIGLRYGPSAGDLNRVTRWLRSHGFTVDTVYPSRVVIDFSGTAAQVSAAFHTTIHRLAVNGENHIANIGDPRIPAALASLVIGPVSLNDIFARPAGHILPAFTADNCGIAKLGGNCRLVAPPDLATIYNFKPVFAGGNVGKGQTIAVVEDSDIYARTDWTLFRRLFGLAAYSSGGLSLTHPAPRTGTNNCGDPGTNCDDFEATLDAEYASAAAPGAEVVVASCASNASWGVNIAIQNLVNAAKPPPILSVSYIYCEASAGAANNAFYRSAFMQAAAEGISVFISAGDEGSAACDYGKTVASLGITVNGLASTVYAVAVGGTDFGDVLHNESAAYWADTNGKTYGSAKSYMPEIPWDSSCASDLVAKFASGSATFGSSGFCNSTQGMTDFLTTRGGGGGPSTCGRRTAQGDCAGYPKPVWQKIVGNPADGARDLPDVSLFSADVVWGHGYVVCLSDPAHDFGSPCSSFPQAWIYGYGTSFAAPIMAGVQALVNTAVGGRRGNPNPTLYHLAAASYGAKGNAGCDATKGAAVGKTCTFQDITEGNIDVPCFAGTPDCYAPSGTYGVLSTAKTGYKSAFPAGTGWDFATGIGSVNVANLVKNWPR